MAFRLRGTVEAWCVGQLELPDWVQVAYLDGRLASLNGGTIVKTSGGDVRAELDDWVVNDGTSMWVVRGPDFFSLYEQL